MGQRRCAAGERNRWEEAAKGRLVEDGQAEEGEVENAWRWRERKRKR